MSFDELFNDPEFLREYETELLIGRVADLIESTLHDAQMSKNELASELGVSAGRISQLISGENLTLKSIAAVLAALKTRLAVATEAIKPKEIGCDTVNWDLVPLTYVSASTLGATTRSSVVVPQVVVDASNPADVWRAA